MIDNVLSILAGLAGLGTLISMLVNLLKAVGVVQDGTSDRWVQGFNLISFVAVAIVYFLNVQVDWGQIDGILTFLATFLGFVIQMLGSRVAYTTLKGLPGVGYSYNTD